MREVTASAPGKVNLLLRCGAPTDDGYHPLVTIFECLDVREYVTVRTSRSPGVRVTTTVYRPDGSIDEALGAELDALPGDSHLAVRAAKALQPLAAMGPWASTSAGLNITVEKHIPVAGGMAGGSADAAAALVACNELWQIGLNIDQLEAIARTLGADVPACLRGGITLGKAIARTLGADVPACLRGGITLGTGRGDHLRSLPEPAEPHHWVMINSTEGLSTPEVFGALDALGGPLGKDGTHAWGELDEPQDTECALYSGGPRELAAVLDNDLYCAARTIRPELERVLDAARQAGALAAAILSGSGPTCAALAEDEAHAHALADTLTSHPLRAEGVIKDLCVVSGPAPGARIEAAHAH